MAKTVLEHTIDTMEEIHRLRNNLFFAIKIYFAKDTIPVGSKWDVFISCCEILPRKHGEIGVCSQIKEKYSVEVSYSFSEKKVASEDFWYFSEEFLDNLTEAIEENELTSDDDFNVSLWHDVVQAQIIDNLYTVITFY